MADDAFPRHVFLAVGMQYSIREQIDDVGIIYRVLGYDEIPLFVNGR